MIIVKFKVIVSLKASLCQGLTGLVGGLIPVWRLARVLEELEIVLSAFLNLRWLINSVALTTTKDSSYDSGRKDISHVIDARSTVSSLSWSRAA